MLQAKSIKVSWVILFIGVFYLLFPTNNSSLDGYGYGAYIKFNEHLFTNHHLLQNYFFQKLYVLLSGLGLQVDVLSFGKLANSFFVVINLWLISTILNYLKVEKLERILLLLFVGFSFNLWRYGTENEVYIVPIFFSLLSSFYFIKYIQLPSSSLKIFIVSFLGAVACLFHQVHFFWWFGIYLGMLIFDKRNRIKVLIYYFLGALVVPLVYALVIFMINGGLTVNTFFEFIFHAFLEGTVQSGYDLLGLFLTIVGFVRSFIQVHPSMLILIKNNSIYVLPIIIAAALFILIIIQIKKNRLFEFRENVNKVFLKTHFLILTFYLLFSHYCYGNIEFIVMLPILVVITILYKYKLNKKVLALICAIFFIWNFSFGIFPNNHYSFFGESKLVDFISAHPNDFFVVKDHTIKNAHYYKNGINSYKKIIIVDRKEKVDSLFIKLKEQKYFYTNIIKEPHVFNRAALTLKVGDSIFKGLKKEKVFQYEGLYGITEVHKVYLNQNKN